MATSTIARRYAEAYFGLAEQAGDFAGWRVGVARAVDVLSRPEAARILQNPRLSLAERTRFALEVLEGVAEPARNLVRLLVERKRIRILADVLEHYDLLVDRASGVVRAEVTSAVAVDPALERRITRALGERLGGAVETTVREDPTLVGGLVIRIGDRVIDGSVRTRLQQLQASLA
ncbi:MAG: F0F1 ATP synthase subunit delta [Candidatus Dormibacteria bacterium]